MKLKGTQVTGIFNFVKGVIFTAGDILIYDGTLYNVISDYDGSDTPDNSTRCISYIEYHSYANDQSPESIITANSFNMILRSYFKGLVGNGELENINIDSISQLDLLIDSGAYFITLTEDVIPTIPSGDYLLRIYKSKSQVIQEFLDFNVGIAYYRNVTKGYYTLIPSNTLEGLKN